MADISFKRNFKHEDWIDNEDVVQADGARGFNVKFHSLEDDLDLISATFAVADAEVKKIQRLSFIVAQAGINVPANSASAEFDVEIYDRSALPANIERVYFAVILPTGPGVLNILHSFLYRPLPANKIKVTISFQNPTGNAVSFAFRVLSLG